MIVFIFIHNLHMVQSGQHMVQSGKHMVQSGKHMVQSGILTNPFFVIFKFNIKILYPKFFQSYHNVRFLQHI